MAQATGIQALGRAADAARPSRTTSTTARRALGAFETAPPTGVRTTRPARRRHYLQYSFAPRLFIFNAFLQSLIGLLRLRPGSPTTSAHWGSSEAAEPEAREEIPLQRRGRLVALQLRRPRVDGDYHELLREFLQSMCTRRLGAALLRLRQALPRLPDRPARARPDRARMPRPRSEPAAIRFNVSKLSAVEVKVTNPNGKLVFNRLATFRRGDGSFTWTPHGPRALHGAAWRRRSCAPGLGEGDRDGGEIEVENRPAEARLGVRRRRWRPAQSSTRARAESARRAWRPPPRGAAPPRASAPSCSPPTRPTACPTRSRPRSGPSPPTSARTCSARRCRPRRRWSATGTACRAGSATCWPSAASTASRPRS